MNLNFTEWLALLLVALLFAKDTLLPAVLKKLGLSSGNGNGSGEYQRQIDALEKHAAVANEEMADVKRDMADMKQDVSQLKNDMTDVKESVAFIRGVVSGRV